MDQGEGSSDTIGDSPRTVKRKVGRSPAFPTIPLDKALERAEELRRAEGKYAVPPSSAYTDWGYGQKSSAARQTLAALRYFGLVEYEGLGAERKVRLTDLAHRILLDRDPNSEIRGEAIWQAAMNPTIFADLRRQFSDDLPSDHTIERYLLIERGFNESAALQVIKGFRRTIEYADSASVGIDEKQRGEGQDREISREKRRREEVGRTEVAATSQTSVSTPVDERERVLSSGLLSKDASYRVLVTGKIGEAEIERLIRKLELDKEILTDDQQQMTVLASQDSGIQEEGEGL